MITISPSCLPTWSHNKELNQLQQRRRWWKRHFEREFALFQTSTLIFHLVQFVKSQRIYLDTGGAGTGRRNRGEHHSVSRSCFSPKDRSESLLTIVSDGKKSYDLGDRETKIKSDSWRTSWPSVWVFFYLTAGKIVTRRFWFGLLASALASLQADVLCIRKEVHSKAYAFGILSHITDG